MTASRDLAAEARAIIDVNRYMTMATANASGTPWATPVYFTPDGYRDFYWLSSPTARHSENVAVRPEVSIVMFNSQAPIGGAEAVYVRASAERVPDAELAACVEVFSSRDPEVVTFGVADLQGAQPLRLYRARAVEHSLLIRGRDPLHPSEVDTRVLVDPTS
jgi:nitroimidazol reductase NimA-like FMN-containing flavoprotein (pyridoxamine 5'-phosphate oxidase superfamily)